LEEGKNEDDKWITVEGRVKLEIYQKPNTKLLYIMHLPYFPNPMTPYITRAKQ
jgi:uncharacterized membrane protein YcgQ (UPF0703/DUF1980 family)